MKRVRKVLDRRRPGALIDLHSANQYNPRDGFASSANLYLEHLPYIDRLWFGEYFDYDAPPDYWLVEISGVPFGLLGEMLEKGGNPWRGMLFGATSRLPWAGDPRPLWKAWDAFSLEGSRMKGWWVPDAPVRTDRPGVLATTYVKPGKRARRDRQLGEGAGRCRTGGRLEGPRPRPVTCAPHGAGDRGLPAGGVLRPDRPHPRRARPRLAAGARRPLNARGLLPGVTILRRGRGTVRARRHSIALKTRLFGRIDSRGTHDAALIQ